MYNDLGKEIQKTQVFDCYENRDSLNVTMCASSRSIWFKAASTSHITCGDIKFLIFLNDGVAVMTAECLHRTIGGKSKERVCRKNHVYSYHLKTYYLKQCFSLRNCSIWISMQLGYSDKRTKNSTAVFNMIKRKTWLSKARSPVCLFEQMLYLASPQYILHIARNVICNERFVRNPLQNIKSVAFVMQLPNLIWQS